MWNISLGLACGCATWIGAMAGLWLVDTQGGDAHADWILAVAVMTPVVAWLHRHRRVRRSMLLLSLALLGFARTADHVSRVHPSMLRLGHAAPETLVRARGILRERLLPVETAARDHLDAWIRPLGEAPWKSTLDLTQMHDGRAWQDRCGIVTLLITMTPPDMDVGAEIEVLGWMSPGHRVTPGTPCDATTHEGCGRSVAILRTDLMPSTVQGPSSWQASLNRLHRWLDTNLLDCLGSRSPEHNRALLVAMTTGRSLPGLRPSRDLFHQAGLSHFLAISGFNVAILLIAARILLEVARVPWRVRGWLLMVLAVVFVVSVAPGVSVTRAGMAGACAGLALGLRRGWRPDAILGVCATTLLLCDPCLATDLGFQLSFGTVIGLLLGAGPVDRWLPGSSGDPATSWLGRCTRWIRTAIAASLAAWLVSVPVTLHAVGTTHPWCALTSTLLGPCAALITVTASTGAVIGWVPGVEHVFQPVLDACVTCMRLGITMGSGLAGSCWDVGRVPGWWCLVALAALLFWWRLSSGRSPRGWVLATILGWFVIALLLVRTAEESAVPVDDSVRWTCLALGEGRANVVQHGSGTTLIDAGSRTARSTGSRLLLPALDSLGVGVIDRIVIRRASMDRFSAVPEVVDHRPVRSVLLSEDWFRAWPEESPQAALLRKLASSRIPIQNLGLIDGWADDGWTWSCSRSTGPARLVAETPLISLWGAQGHQSPVIAFIGGCSASAILRATPRRGLHGVGAIDWPPMQALDEESSEILAALEPGHVVQVRGAATPEQSLFRRRAGWRPWGILQMDDSLQYRVSDSGTPEGLFRWSCSGWKRVRRD